jgi:hypothetical protein
MPPGLHNNITFSHGFGDVINVFYFHKRNNPLSAYNNVMPELFPKCYAIYNKAATFYGYHKGDEASLFDSFFSLSLISWNRIIVRVSVLNRSVFSLRYRLTICGGKTDSLILAFSRCDFIAAHASFNHGTLIPPCTKFVTDPYLASSLTYTT